MCGATSGFAEAVQRRFKQKQSISTRNRTHVYLQL